MRRLIRLAKALWTGEVPLGRAFWEYAMVWGSLANLLTSVAYFALLATPLHPALALLMFALPIPYNVFVAVAVWRSADRYAGPRSRADLARLAVVLWAIAASLT